MYLLVCFGEQPRQRHVSLNNTLANSTPDGEEEHFVHTAPSKWFGQILDVAAPC